jgi:hypothetical protein
MQGDATSTPFEGILKRHRPNRPLAFHSGPSTKQHPMGIKGGTNLEFVRSNSQALPL